MVYAVLALALPAMPAQAADLANLDCPAAAMTAQQRAAVGELAADLGSDADSRMTVFTNALDRCAADSGWSVGAREAARRFGLGSMGQIELRRRFSRDGIDVAPLERAILDDVELSRAIRALQVTNVHIGDFARRRSALIARVLGRRSVDTAFLERAGIFIAFRTVIEASRAEFAAR